jgi:MinD-like ATPase involved in chromosome partitioning or flagellar assembly
MTETSPQIHSTPPTPSDPQLESVPLTAEHLLTNRRPEPSGGWRRLVWLLSGKKIIPAESAAEIERRTLIAQAQTPVARGHHRIAVMSLKGGVGKTTTTAALGNTLASLRGDRVIAIDANPDRGTLGLKVKSETAATIRTLLAEAPHIVRYADARAFTSQSPARLEILASDTDPAVSEAFNAEDYRTVAGLIERYYSICITDCGTGLLHGAMGATLDLADQIVLVSLVAVDGANSAAATLDWLNAHGHADLARNAIVVLNAVEPKTDVDLDLLERHFNTRCRTVIRIPYDPHLKEGAEVDLARLRPTTRGAYLRLAAAAGQAFSLHPDRSH